LIGAGDFSNSKDRGSERQKQTLPRINTDTRGSGKANSHTENQDRVIGTSEKSKSTTETRRLAKQKLFAADERGQRRSENQNLTTDSTDSDWNEIARIAMASEIGAIENLYRR
jgi:hypothetical protein